MVVHKHLSGKDACLSPKQWHTVHRHTCTEAKCIILSFPTPHRLDRIRNDHTRIISRWIGGAKKLTSFRDITGSEPYGSLRTTSTHIYNIQHTVHTHCTLSAKAQCHSHWFLYHFIIYCPCSKHCKKTNWVQVFSKESLKISKRFFFLLEITLEYDILCHTINTVRHLGHPPWFWNKKKKAASEVAVRHVLWK